MLGIFLRIVGFGLFLVGAFNQTLFGHGSVSLGLFGLAAWILATLVGAWGPNVTLNRAP